MRWDVLRGAQVVGAGRRDPVGADGGDLSWSGSDLDAERRGLRLAVERSFAELGLTRVQARVPSGDLRTLRTAALAGLRREGVLRGAGPAGGDQVLVACLRGDPDPHSRDGFIALLNAGLPTKRVIAQGLVRDHAGRVLLCELTYKAEWDLPGGVVEPGESPREGVVREVGEELGIDVAPERLLTVNWLAPWRGWDDACVFVFDLGVHDASLVRHLSLQPTEIAAVRWCDTDTVTRRATRATAALLAFLRERPDGVPYVENASPPRLP